MFAGMSSPGRMFSMAPEGVFLAKIMEKVLKVPTVGEAFAPATGEEQFSKLSQAAVNAFKGNPYPIGKMMRLKNAGIWNPTYGDRCQELVLIGVNLDKVKLRKELESCLLTDEEYKAGPKTWKKMADPWCDGEAPKLFWDLPDQSGAAKHNHD